MTGASRSEAAAATLIWIGMVAWPVLAVVALVGLILQLPACGAS